MLLMSIMLICIGWIMFVYGMWLYEHAYALFELNNNLVKRESTYFHLGYAVMIEGSICYLLPFFY